MAYYNPRQETQLTVNASPYGLGAILSNIDKHGAVRNVAYGSRSLTATEQRYSQTEREALALVWGCERFHMYLIGTKFQLFTDHKALEILFSPNSHPTARIERWALRLQQYDFVVKYRKGADNPADILSRMPLSSSASKPNVADHYVNFIASHAVPQAMTIAEIEEATAQDELLQIVITSFQTDQWPDNEPSLKPYYRLRHELSVTESNVVLRGRRIIIPSALRHKTLNIAHHGHQGTVKMKQLLRTKVWWPNIDKQVESFINSCLPCQATGIPIPPPPLHVTDNPLTPWTHLHMDFCGPFPSGEMIFVLIDSYSKFPQVEIMKSTTAQSLISRLERIFATHGLPTKITSDNAHRLTVMNSVTILKKMALSITV